MSNKKHIFQGRGHLSLHIIGIYHSLEYGNDK